MDTSNIEKQSIAGIVILVVLATWVCRALSGPLARLPGPWYTKWTELGLKYRTLKGRRPEYVHELHEKYGPVVRISPHEASLMDVTAARTVYSVKAEYHKSPWYRQLFPKMETIFSTIRVDKHRHLRRLLSSSLSESSLITHKAVVDSKVRLAIQRMGEEMESRGTMDVYHWALSMATDVIGELSFGESFKTLETGVKSQYTRDLEATDFTTIIQLTFPTLTWLSNYIPISGISGSTERFERLHQYAAESLQRHSRIVDEQGEYAKPTLLSKIYKAGEDGLDFTDIQNTAQDYIAAGSDTTANTLTYFIWLVCKHPEVKAKLIDQLSALPESFDDGDLKKIPYLSQCIDETLRLYSAVPSGLPRLVPHEGANFNGHYIPGGSTVSIQAYSIHRNGTVFPDPQRFDPSRWETPTQLMKDSFVPFGGGSRVCIGQHLARIELRLAAARFFHTFPDARVSTREGFCDEDMRPVIYFLLAPSKMRCLIEAH